MFDVGKQVLMPVFLPELTKVVGTIVAWVDFPADNGYYRVYEVVSNDGKHQVTVSKNLLREYKWEKSGSK